MQAPSCFVLNPVCSIWKKPLLKARYRSTNNTWEIEQGCHTRYIMQHLDKTNIKTYRLDKEMLSSKCLQKIEQNT